MSTTAYDCHPILYVCSMVSAYCGRRVNAVRKISPNSMSILPSCANRSNTNAPNGDTAPVIAVRIEKDSIRYKQVGARHAVPLPEVTEFLC